VQSAGITGEMLAEHFERAGHDAFIDADPDTSFDDRIKRAIESDADVIVGAGGDGTVTGLASAMVDSGKPLAMLPLGTANLLARDLKIPLDISEWMAALADMEPHPIDVGMVNGHPFLHKVVIGLIPQLAAGREQIRGGGVAAKVGFVRYFFRRLARARRLAVEIAPGEGEGDPRIVRVQSLAVASNSYDEGFGRFFSRAKLDGGYLTLYTLKHLNAGDVFRLTAAMIAGNWTTDESLGFDHVHDVTIRSTKPRLQVMLDGEIMSFDVPLHFTIRPKALPILAPLPVEEEVAAPADDPDYVVGI
jgi:diacylglycerol kinase family enzyme